MEEFPGPRAKAHSGDSFTEQECWSCLKLLLSSHSCDIISSKPNPRLSGLSHVHLQPRLLPQSLFHLKAVSSVPHIQHVQHWTRLKAVSSVPHIQHVQHWIRESPHQPLPKCGPSLVSPVSMNGTTTHSITWARNLNIILHTGFSFPSSYSQPITNSCCFDLLSICQAHLFSLSSLSPAYFKLLLYYSLIAGLQDSIQAPFWICSPQSSQRIF